MKGKGDGYESHTASLYGRETFYDPQARSFSPAPSQLGMYPPPGYQSGRNTPQSMFVRPMSEAGHLHQPAPSRPVTNYLDFPTPGETFGLSSNTGDGPSDAEIERVVQDVLRLADLNTVTKRGIRKQLEDHFGMDLTSRKTTINAAIDRVLLSQT